MLFYGIYSTVLYHCAISKGTGTFFLSKSYKGSMLLIGLALNMLNVGVFMRNCLSLQNDKCNCESFKLEYMGKWLLYFVSLYMVSS